MLVLLEFSEKQKTSEREKGKKLFAFYYKFYHYYGKFIMERGLDGFKRIAPIKD